MINGLQRRGTAPTWCDRRRGHDLASHGTRFDCGMQADDETPAAVPWFSPGYTKSLQGKMSAAKPREHVWTLVKDVRRLDASLMFQGESYGWEAQLPTGVQMKVAFGRGPATPNAANCP